MFNLNYNFMAQFNDTQVLHLLVNRINEMYRLLPSAPTGDHNLDCYDSGRRFVLEILSEALSFYQDYEFD